ncbi:helix-hairpin-helix domain-containing protein [Larkinella punicea]|uniref:DNA polymerase/3'-5' exonuclease PolX n=1 Tax=Larkinella punicea TaxID=2315727 RepID=A0A368JEL4_9BACT|nr:helix-hairpin-helix domain-containing protein [Larkinella punicea]RCR66118.1 DNA polymerase/3'-5' exonuclease PolX [Larkinella punicea]
MTNTEIIDILELTAKLMELHDVDAFKTRSFQAAAFNLDKISEDLSKMSFPELLKLPGVGKSVAGKVLQIIETGRLQDLDDLLAQTPEGVLEMFRIKGIGAKKIRIIWRDFGIDTIRDLRLACESGEIAKIKGFGEKTQQAILESLAFLENQSGKLRMDKAEALSNMLLDVFEKEFSRVEVAGQIRRKSEEVDTVQYIVCTSDPIAAFEFLNSLSYLEQNEIDSSPFIWRGQASGYDVQLEIITTPSDRFESQLFTHSAAEKHLTTTGTSGRTLLQTSRAFPAEAEEAVYERAGLPFIVPEMREGGFEFDWAQTHSPDDLVTWDALRGILHNHSTYSDGKHSLEQMATYCRELGFSYFGIADHSQSATYAKGLEPYRVQQQHEEIDRLNAQFGGSFKILKGIESDILGDGSLDYSDDLLATFDYVVASVHSNLSMTSEKATARLINAIQNPYTTILGHPTGRLLLARAGYPIDYKAVIDACAQHGVVIEINASPWRLDLDWRWIQYAVNQGVMLSINPDAHEMPGFHDMHYGVAVARKGGLTKSMTFNALSLNEIEAHLQKRRRQ